MKRITANPVNSSKGNYKVTVEIDGEEIKDLENKIGQLQYEISCLGLDQEELTGVTIRTEELKALVKKLNIPSVIHCTDLEPYFVNALNQLVKTQRQPTKKRF